MTRDADASRPGERGRVPPENAGLVPGAAAAPVAVVSAEAGGHGRVGAGRRSARGCRALPQLLETLAQPAVQRLDGRRRQLAVHLQTVLQDRELPAAHARGVSHTAAHSRGQSHRGRGQGPPLQNTRKKLN